MKKSLLSYSLSLIFAFGGVQAVSFAQENAKSATVQTAAQTVGYQKLNITINKSPTDNAIYQPIRLANGMDVLLISDDKANKSLFAVGLPIGSMEDPKSQQGLAHYLEHMILMGSKNYPETNSLDGFLTQNGGRNNAYTAPDRTVYYLQVNHNAFDEAVARLADAFAAPLLDESNATKERNAVNAEMVRAKSSDGHRIRSANLATANPAHPYTQFAVGNNESLSDKPESKLQTELENFYQQFYSANLMKAVLYANQPIDKLASLAKSTLGKVANKSLTVPQTDEPLFREQDLGVVLHYVPISPNKSITISFPMPEDKAAFRQKSGEYLAYLFSNNTEGTLSDYLIKNGLSDTGVAAYYSDDISRNQGSFDIMVRLTDKGLVAQDQVISLIFQQIERISENGIQPSYFSELKESLKQEFQHLRIDKNFNYVADLASQMLSYPLENIFDQEYVADEMNPDEIKAKLALMRLDNARIFIVDEKAKTDRTTPYFDAPYSVVKISDEQRKKWLDFSQNPELKLPSLNPYFATDFSLNDVDNTHTKPKLIAQSQGTEIYAMPSQFFANEAKARLSISLRISPKADDLKQEIAAGLLNVMNGLAHRQMDFQASVAGMDTALSVSPNGIGLSIEGYTQHLSKLLQDMLANFSQFELTESAFEQAKQRYIESLDALDKAQAQRQALQPSANLGRYPYFDVTNKRRMLTEITLADVASLRQKLLNEITTARVLSLGNLSDEQVKALLKALENSVKHHDSVMEYGRYVDINQRSDKLNFIKKIPHEDNALAVSFFARGLDEIEGSVKVALLNSIIARWYFDDLRTDKQLGYVVSASQDRIGKTSGIVLIVQSPTASTKSIMVHNQRFIDESLKRLQSLTEDEFAKYRASLVEIMQHKPESLASEFSEYSRDFARGNANFDSKQKALELLKNIGKQDIIDFYQHLFVEQQGLVLISQAIGTKAELQETVELDGFEKVESVEMLQKGFEVKTY